MATVETARAHLRTVDVQIEPRKLWPAGLAGRKGRINGCGVGRALAFADDPAWEAVLADLNGRDAPISTEIADAMVGGADPLVAHLAAAGGGGGDALTSPPGS